MQTTREATLAGRALLPSRCRHLRWVFRNLPRSSSTQLALSLMGDACKTLCWVIAALFFKQVAAFSACYSLGEESRCHCIPARAILNHSCRGRDSLCMKSTQGNSPFHVCKHLRKSCFFLFSFSFSSLNKTLLLSAAAAIGLCFQCFGTCLIFSIFIAKPVERGTPGEVTCSLCHLLTKANAPPACHVTKSKMLQVIHCL